MAERRKFPWLRRLKWPAVVFALLLVILYGLVPLIATPIIRNRLQKQLSTQLDAQLQMGRVYYWFPYGVTVSDAVLVAKDEQGEPIQLLKIDKLKLSLAHMPFGEGPLVIRKLILQRPEIHLLVTDEGMVGRHSPVKAETPASLPATQPEPPQPHSTQPAPATAPATPPQRRPKLSEMLELQHVRIEDAQIIYEDRQDPQSVPAAWRNINIDLATSPATNPIYQFDFTASNGEMAELRIAGSINIDELEASLTQISAKMNLAAKGTESAVPAAMQRLLLDNNVRGNVTLNGKSTLPLRKIEEAQFDLHINLADGAARIAADAQDTFDRINATFRLSSEPLTDEQAFMATAAQLRAANGTAASGGKRKRLPAAYLLLEQAEILMADNRLEMKNAALAYDLRLKEWEVKQARGTLELGEQKNRLPKPLRAATEKPQFLGSVQLTLDAHGSMVRSHDPPRRRPYLVTLKAQCPQLIMGQSRLVATNVSCNMRMTPGLVQFVSEDASQPPISGDFYGGTIAGFGAIRTNWPAKFDFAGNIQNADMRAFVRDWTSADEVPSQVSGRAFANFQIGWTSSHAGKRAIDLLTSEGTFEVVDGDFYDLPVVSKIAALISLNLNKDAGRVGQAAAKFKIKQREMYFQPIAISSPALGLHGEGKMSFDGQLDFKAVAAPLADWKQQMQKTKIPLIDSVGAELVGGIQKILDSTTGKLLYQFKITGTRGKPVVTSQPAPILTEDGMNLLKNMIKGTGRLLDQI